MLFLFRFVFGVAKFRPLPLSTSNTNHQPLQLMSDKSIEDRVKDIIVDQLGVNADQVTPEAKFVEDLGADSLDTVELVMAFEEEFGGEISDVQAQKISPVFTGVPQAPTAPTLTANTQLATTAFVQKDKQGK